MSRYRLPIYLFSKFSFILGEECGKHLTGIDFLVVAIEFEFVNRRLTYFFCARCDSHQYDGRIRGRETVSDFF